MFPNTGHPSIQAGDELKAPNYGLCAYANRLLRVTALSNLGPHADLHVAAQRITDWTGLLGFVREARESLLINAGDITVDVEAHRCDLEAFSLLLDRACGCYLQAIGHMPSL